MALTVAEANAVNTLLGWLFNNPNALGEQITPQRAREAAQLLADQAHRTIMCGLDGARVAAAWEALIARSCEVCGCTDAHACEGGCQWSERNPELCTACEDVLDEAATGHRCVICGDPDDHDGRPHSEATGDGRTRAAAEGLDLASEALRGE